jgi:hypothetical protein
MAALTAQDSDDDDTGPLVPSNSFVADSPMKPPPKEGGAFHRLFEDSVGTSSAALPLPQRIQSRTKTMFAAAGVFPPSQRARSPSLSSDDDPDPVPAPVKTREGTRAANGGSKGIRVRMGNGSTFGQNTFSGSTPEPPAPHALQEDSRKRRLSLADADVQNTNALEDEDNPPLLPPSPPPADSHTAKNKYKGKGKAAPRKKAKVTAGAREEGEDESESSDGGQQLPVREWTFHRRKDDAEAEDDIDPMPLFRASQGVPMPDLDDDEGAFEVELRDELQRTLSLDANSTHGADEAGVARGVLYGVRTRHYDGSRGGNIWDVGELSEGAVGEDDWEGEPVPWEVGEM